MQIFNHTNESIFYEESEPKELTPMERATKSLENARRVMSDKKSSEPTLNVYEQYKMLQASNPRSATVFWRENKDAIWACANSNK